MLLITRERSKRLPRRAILRPKLFLMKVLMENSSVAQSQAVWGHLELIRAVTFRNLNNSFRHPNYPKGGHFEQDSCLCRFGRVSWQHCYPHHPPLAETFLPRKWPNWGISPPLYEKSATLNPDKVQPQGIKMVFVHQKRITNAPKGAKNV